MNNNKASLVLKDGRIFRGRAFGARGVTSGEVVFNTSLTGYQEIVTDPSYAGQMVAMTYPLIGNYGVSGEDNEAKKIAARGFIVKEGSHISSNWRSEANLDAWLTKLNIIGIQGIDTRALTRHIRLQGAMPGIIASDGSDPELLITDAEKLTGTEKTDWVKEVTCHEPSVWEEGSWTLGEGFKTGGPKKYKVVAFDLGAKRNILRSLVDIGADLTVVPASTAPDAVRALKPDGIFLSNGPGDPSAVSYVSNCITEFVGSVPIFGICLGHQLLCRSLGAETYKLKFGHHGGNQPVLDKATGKVEITAQNHNYAVAADSLPDDLEVTHINLNDQSVEGVRSKSKPLFSVQYHPEAAPGPHDSAYLFERFAQLMETSRE